MARTRSLSLRLLSLSAVAVLGAGCDDDAPAGGATDVGRDATADASDQAQGVLSITGTYVDDFGGVHRISDGTYILGWAPNESVTNISAYDNAAGWVVGQNTADHPWNPDAWSRFDWTEVEGALYVCQSVFDGESEADALSAAPSDASDPTTGGCGGSFPWSALTEGQGALAVLGVWVDGDGVVYDLSDESGVWTLGADTFAQDSYDNELQYAVAHNGAANPESAGLWSRFDWAWEEGTLYLCHTTASAADAAAAEQASAPSSTSPATSGCNGGAWIELSEGT
jgi:hypothetical protein